MIWKRCFGFGMLIFCAAGLYYVPPGEMEYVLLIAGIAGLLVLLLDDKLQCDMEALFSMFLCAHWSVLLRFPVYYIQRSRMLYRAKENWQKHNKITISKKDRDRMTSEACVDFIQTAAKQEAENKSASGYLCRVVPYHKEYRHEYLWVQVDAKNRRILWNTASIEHHSVLAILEELILAMQQYYFYCQLNAEEQQILNRFTEKQSDEQLLYWNYLLYEHLRFKRNMNAYDIITRQYARVKSGWYCGK